MVFLIWLKKLNFIKSQERNNGIKMGKMREYFKKGTWEYERKQYLKNKIKKYEEDNDEYKSIKQDICNIKQQITNIGTELLCMIQLWEHCLFVSVIL